MSRGRKHRQAAPVYARAEPGYTFRPLEIVGGLASGQLTGDQATVAAWALVHADGSPYAGHDPAELIASLRRLYAAGYLKLAADGRTAVLTAPGLPDDGPWDD